MSPVRQRDAQGFIASHLTRNPLERIPGKTKELRGKYKGVMQYDIDRNDRIMYRVDKAERVVFIQYIGPHPDL